ncbi:hypothetical protein CAP48_03795 [Advenella sp. S44]|uniref:phospholipase effector Tle1 domain-containing protein n=1 Tax=Advenella sp. S44 TaxID=1982755 RepID=UPI000C2A4038|nr:DUF2235 domain-containing protein [Advenella sp. S44]PJX28299.1 hypothetical protein CAP48_03795 [Advenella sp. S44]
MRTRPRSIFPVRPHWIAIIAGMLYFASEGVAGQANNAQCPRPPGSANPCLGSSPYTLQANEPVVNIGAGNPVNLATGNKYQEAVDVPLRADGLLLVRSYNAMDRTDLGLGSGWRHNFDIYLQRTPNGLQITQADGSRIAFNPRAGQVAAANAPAYGRLQLAASGWTWRWPNGSTLTFDHQGLLSSIRVDRHHLQIQRYSRASIFADKIRHVTSQAGHTLVFHYDRDTRFNARIRLTQIDTPDGPIRYTYDPVAARLAFATISDGSQTRYLYEPAYQAGDPFKLTGLAVAAPEKKNANHVFDSKGQLTRIIALRTGRFRAAGTDKPGWALHAVNGNQNVLLPSQAFYRLRTWHYDKRGRVIRAVMHDEPAGVGTQLFSYLPIGAQRGITRIADGNGHDTTFVWRQRHGRYLLESAKGHGCLGCPAPGLQATYYEDGRLSSINGLYIARHPGGMPSRLSLSDGFWPGLQLHYNPQGLLTFWRSALTGDQTIRYNSKGQPTAQAFANGVRWSYEYDSRYRLRLLREVAAAGSMATTHIRYPQAGGFSLTHPNETRIHAPNPVTGVLRIGVTRPATPDNPHRVHYEDVLLSDPQARQVIHLLPEGGRLQYTYTPAGQLRAIVWEDAGGQRHPVLQINKDGLLAFGNHVRAQYRRDMSGRQQLHVVALAGATIRPILGLDRQVGRDGRILGESYYFPAAASAVKRHYMYGPQQRLAGMIEQHYRYPGGQLARAPVASRKRRIWYAWDSSGAAIARSDGQRIHRSRIVRDASGLPVQVDRVHTRYAANRRLERVYRQGKRILQNLHNGQGLRIVRHDEQALTHFYYQDNRVVGHWSVKTGAPLRIPPNGAISRRYIYAGAIPVAFIDYATAAAFMNAPAAPHAHAINTSIRDALRNIRGKKPAGTLHFIHTDTLGLPLAVTDGQARTVWLARPQPQGKMTPMVSRLTLHLRYPGQYEDEATGWFDNIYRTYDPAFGHYLEPDPAGPLPGADPLGYAAGQPRRYIDPLGLLLFAFDGTRNQGSQSNSNVYKLQKQYNSGPVHYIGGPGTTDGVYALAEPAVYGVSSVLQRPYILGPLGVLLRPLDTLFADSVPGIVRTQMHRLIDSLLTDAASLRTAGGHIPIDIIGFSRGATAARIFANLLMQQTRDGLFTAKIHAPYAKNGQAPDGIMTVSACLDFRFMGLFDTVTQLGVLGSNNAAHDYRVSPAWHWVAHAVALNEHNNIFPLTSIGRSDRQNFHEIGFMGNHSDMGGTIQDTDTTSVANASGLPGDLGNVVLQWMHQQGLSAGVAFKPLPQDLLRIRNPLVHNNLMGYEPENPASERLASDRKMETEDGITIRQHQSVKFGRARRMQIEQFIERDLPTAHALTVADLFYGNMMAVPPGKEKALVSQPIVGRADIQAYAKWLRETAGFELQTGQVW